MKRESDTRFLTSGCFQESVSPGPLSISLGPFQIFMKIGEDIHNFVFIAGLNNTGDQLFASINNTGDKLSPVSLLPAINIAGVVDTGDRILIDSTTL